MRKIAEQIVDSLIEGRVTDWLSDRWQDIKAVTGIGSDEFGMGKNTEKGWKPKYGPTGTTFVRKPVKPKPRDRRFDDKTSTWDITP